MKRSNTTLVLLIVLIIVILLVGIFLFTPIGAAPLSVPACKAAAASYSCGDVAYNFKTGALNISILQNTSRNWTSAQLLFVPNTTKYSNGVPVISWTNATVIQGGWKNGIYDNVSLQVSGPVSAGTPLQGQIWAAYQLNAGGTTYYIAIANVTTHAE